MFKELISKKELLEVMGISYGQLYRWKRKGLIPEEWFIKKSVSTGQETFFPKEKVLERIRIILELKSDASLDELAHRFSNNIKDIKINRDYIINSNIVPEQIVKMFEEIIEADTLYDESNLFALFIYQELLKIGLLNLEEVKNITLSTVRDYKKIQDKDYTLIIKRKLGICFYYAINGDEELFEDNEAILIYKIIIKRIIEKVNNLK